MLYTIKKGNHRSTWLPKFTCKNEVVGKVTFLGDFSYEILNQEDTNKLCGLSDGWHHRKASSIRLGFRWNLKTEELEIMVISYVNGQRTIKKLTVAETDREYDFSIRIEKDYYFVIFNKDSLLIPRKSKWNCLRYRLGFYFGGREVAPKTLKINLDIEK